MFVEYKHPISFDELTKLHHIIPACDLRQLGLDYHLTQSFNHRIVYMRRDFGAEIRLFRNVITAARPLTYTKETDSLLATKTTSL